MSTTIKKHLASIVTVPKSKFDSIIEWPPDVFAVAASLLQTSGAYCLAVDHWGSSRKKGPKKLHRPASLDSCGQLWRKNIIRGQKAPALITKKWKVVINHLQCTLDEIHKTPSLIEALLDLLGASDAACEGIGAPGAPEPTDDFHKLALEILSWNKALTLCLRIRRDVVCVLPKSHTPQVGMTIRSLSHHIALITQGETTCHWYPIPSELSSTSASIVNLLILPYPYAVDPNHFKALKNVTCGRAPLPPEFGFFNYTPPSPDDWIDNELPKSLQKAKKKADEIHGVVFPEGCFPSDAAFVRAEKAINKVFPKAFVLAGVVSPNDKTKVDSLSNNKLRYSTPLILPGVPAMTGDFNQSKHHRWKLEETQIRRYAINNLDRGRQWWEYANISKRELHFFSARCSLTFCFLICEDLARQEPVAPLVRALGPHLVIALLQDGPQWEERWSGRYASVLAEDPGCSVLTVTSLGMLQLKPEGATKAPKGPFCIGLWRDKEKSTPLEISSSAKGLLLKLRSEQKPESSADGRSNPTASTLFYDSHLPI